MRILFLTPYVPSFRAGGEKFTKLLLEDLSKENQIDLIYYKYAFDKDYIPPNGNIHVLKVCKNSFFVKCLNFIKYPFYHPTFTIRFSFSLLHYIRNLWKSGQYDLLYLDHSQMLLYGRFFPKAKKILMSHDVMAERFGHKENLIAKIVRYSEGRLMRMPNLTIFTFSEKDVNIVKKSYGLVAKHTNFFLDDCIIKATPSKIDNAYVFFGKWKRSDNFDGLKWFFDTVYPHRPKTEKYRIIGIGLPKDFSNYISTLPNVEYLGFVDNPYEIITNSRAVISPIFSGAGVKVKVVEALACGVPVIGNKLAFEGISNEFSSFMKMANSLDEYVDLLDGSLEENVDARCDFKDRFLKQYCGLSISTYLKRI